MQDDDAAIDDATEAVGEHVGTPADDPKDLIREARELIPVGRGATPINFQQMVDFARDMSKAKLTIPQHLKGSVGDCLAVVDIATRAGLSPYMVANKTYIKSGHLEFESQLYHAFAQASGLLRGDLMIAYEGEGDDLVCVITGYLKNDSRPRVHTSEKLKDAHPGHSETDKGRFVRGSQLWDSKPKVQLAYDTMRDWVRLYAPRATLGMPEFADSGDPEFARDVTPVSGSGLAARLAASPQSTDGHKDGHAEAELKAIAQATADAKGTASAHASEPAAEGDDSAKEAKRASKPPKGKAKAQQENTTPAKADRGTATSKVAYPSNVTEYVAYARRWLKSESSKVAIGERWKEERKMRNSLGVTEEDRAPLEALMKKVLGQ